jgi:hypothetical protein
MGCHRDRENIGITHACYYHEWRFGQAVANVAFWSAGAKIESIWEVDDMQFLESRQKRLEKTCRKASEVTAG